MSQSAPPAAPPAPTTQERYIGNYRIVETLGEGGMGIVYAARHRLLGRPAAIKVLLPQYSKNKQLVDRFLNEARAAAAAKNPGIVEIYDFGEGEQNGEAFIAMEYLEGETLETRLRRLGQIPLPQALLFTSQIASALTAAHGQGVIHRDLKPANVFIVADPQVMGGERIKLLDFGIAKLSVAEADTDSRTTRADAIMGTPSYMAPEQCRGAQHVDGRADLYSVGCIVFEMLCGRPPFVGATSLDVMSAHLRDEPPRPSSLQPMIGPELEAMILALLAKDPAARFQRAVDLERAVHMMMSGNLSQVMAHAGAMTQIGQAGMVDAPAPWYRRLAIPIALAVTMAAGGALFGVLGQRDEQQPATAPAPPPVTPSKPPEPPPPLTPPRFYQLGTDGNLPAEAAQADADAKQVLWRITSTPPGARVVYGGERVGSTDTPLIVVVPRNEKRTEELTLDLYGYVQQTVSLSAAEDREQTVELVKEVKLQLRSKPKGAIIHDLEDKGYGPTPGVVAVPPGTEPIKFVLKLDGYADAVVEIVPDKDRVTEATLTPLVTLRIESEPAGATVSRDGQRLGVTPYEDRVPKSRDSLTYQLSLDGYEDASLTLGAGRNATKKVALDQREAEAP